MLTLRECSEETERAIAWITTQLKSKSPQVLAVGPPIKGTGTR
jgi:hypothetical protein